MRQYDTKGSVFTQGLKHCYVQTNLRNYTCKCKHNESRVQFLSEAYVLHIRYVDPDSDLKPSELNMHVVFDEESDVLGPRA